MTCEALSINPALQFIHALFWLQGLISEVEVETNCIYVVQISLEADWVTLAQFGCYIGGGALHPFLNIDHNFGKILLVPMLKIVIYPVTIVIVKILYSVTYTGCFFTLGLPLKVQSTKKLIYARF